MAYGGDTSCVLVTADDGSVLVLDAGSGLRRLNEDLPAGLTRLDILLTHLHMDHIQGLGFFKPLFDPEVEVNLWGPVSSTMRKGGGRDPRPPPFVVSRTRCQAVPPVWQLVPNVGAHHGE